MVDRTQANLHLDEGRRHLINDQAEAVECYLADFSQKSRKNTVKSGEAFES